MKHWRAILHYYKDQLAFSLGFLLTIWVFSSLIWAVLFFVLFGALIGLIGYNQLYANRLYFYYNLGFTKLRLLLIATCLNVVLLVPFGLFGIVLYLLQ